jgi:hypothetical protein
MISVDYLSGHLYAIVSLRGEPAGWALPFQAGNFPARPFVTVG